MNNLASATGEPQTDGTWSWDEAEDPADATPAALARLS